MHVAARRRGDGRLQAAGFDAAAESQLRRLAEDGCKIRTRAKVSGDPAASSLANSYYYPTDQSWRAGDRNVTCVAVAADEGTKLTRPLRG